jgi:hypothetical protein
MSKELNLVILLCLVVFCGYITHTLFLAQNSIKQRLIAIEVKIDHEKRLKAIEEKLK